MPNHAFNKGSVRNNIGLRQAPSPPPQPAALGSPRPPLALPLLQLKLKPEGEWHTRGGIADHAQMRLLLASAASRLPVQLECAAQRPSAVTKEAGASTGTSRAAGSSVSSESALTRQHVCKPVYRRKILITLAA